MSTVGIFGTGRMATRLARLFANSGQCVLLGSRIVERARAAAARIGHDAVEPATYAQVAKAPVVVPAMFLRDGLLETLEPLRRSLEGKLWIDITNPFNSDYSDFILPWDTSSAEVIQRRFPAARLVGAFKNVWWEVFDRPNFGSAVSDVYVVGDDSESKREFFALVRGSPFRYLDAGRLANARTVERMTLLSGELGQRYRFFPRMNYLLLGEEVAA